MLWELIATVFAGLGAAGIALLLRKLSKNRAPRWLIPVFAGAAMLGFQIQSEYSWYQHTASRLPAGVVVIKKIEQQTALRPWSYLYPQTLRFIAADVNNASQNQLNNQIMLVDLYFFQRRATARRPGGRRRVRGPARRGVRAHGHHGGQQGLRHDDQRDAQYGRGGLHRHGGR